jgi:hypothetical protein
MSHLTEEQLTLACYGDTSETERQHLKACAECRTAFERIQAALNDLPDHPVPERPPEWEADVWKRVAVHLSPRKTTRSWIWWTLAPVMATLLVIAFLAGIMTERRSQKGLSQTARARVLLTTTGDHLDRAERVLAELTNAAPGLTDFAEERIRARGLLIENRLLRQTALRDGNASTALLLDELERTLLDIAHISSNPSPLELETLQRRIESNGLLFRIRITDSNFRQKEQKL